MAQNVDSLDFLLPKILCAIIAYSFLSTSNHNTLKQHKNGNQLYLIINLHQTTTASVFVPILQGFISPS